jgi:hypothetical protein
LLDLPEVVGKIVADEIGGKEALRIDDRHREWRQIATEEHSIRSTILDARKEFIVAVRAAVEV